MNPKGKYVSSHSFSMPERHWPCRCIAAPPIWCSVDLRDGNQALAKPMTIEQKLEMFECLVGCGFREIEVGYPAASPTDYAFIRLLINENRIPEGVTIQVLVAAREDLISKTVESLVGAKNVIIHLYNSTSQAQRRVVFGMEKKEIVELAVRGVNWIKKYSSALAGTNVVLQYSPESFSATELEFSLQICEAVMDAWGATTTRKIILNLPATVEVAMPNVFADQVEWICNHLARRDAAVISVHAHNDRGTGVAATELALLASADRVEGTLFGNGERTGNTDLVVVALNLYTQGVDPLLDFSDIGSIREVYERCSGMSVHLRQPYSGELVFTAFSGTHQDAISKGLKERAGIEGTGAEVAWDVPYLPIDPGDIGRTYNGVIRVNGQSGKGGTSYLLEQKCGIYLPKDLLREFQTMVGARTDSLGGEVVAEELREMLFGEYVRIEPYIFSDFESHTNASGCSCSCRISVGHILTDTCGEGNGPVDAFVRALSVVGGNMHILHFSEHALGAGADVGAEASAIAYVQIRFATNDGDVVRWGVGVDTSVQMAPIIAVMSALNRRS